MKYTKLPPGTAYGARDLQDWSSRRKAGLAGTTHRDAPRTRQQALERAADRILKTGRVDRSFWDKQK